MSSSKQTLDHQKIKKWVEERDGVPTIIKGTESGHGEGLLRVHFPNAGNDDHFKKISWDDFFEKFEEKELVFVYQDEKDSTFHKMVSRGE